jgi:hypothetical protein
MGTAIEHQNGRTQSSAILSHGQQAGGRHSKRDHPNLGEVFLDLKTATFESVPPFLRFDIGLSPIIKVDLIFPGGFTPLFEIRAEDPHLESGGPHIDGKNVPLHMTGE